MQIHKKLFLVLSAFSFLILTLMALLFQWSIDRGMVDYVNQREMNALQSVVEVLENRYLSERNWNSLIRNHQQFRLIIDENLKGTVFQPPNRPNIWSTPEISDEDNLISKPNRPRPLLRVSYALLDHNKKLVVGHFPNDAEYSYLPLHSDKKIIGYLAVSKRHQLTDGYEFEFIQSQRIWLWSAVLLVLVVILLISFPLSKHLVAPILQLREAFKQTKHGVFVSVPTTNRQDEFSHLYNDYNQLVAELQTHDQARKRWLADISHELRTPIAIIRGELEAMLDKVRPLTMESINSVHDEVLTLQGLTEDLHTLNSAEIGGMDVKLEALNIVDFIDSEMRNISGYLSDAGIQTHLNFNHGSPLNMRADPKRLRQLLNNLFSNVVNYANATEIHVRIYSESKQTGDQVVIKIEDNGRGVATEHLPMLFDPLFRVDSSRNRSKGGTGLGLAICAHIINGHGGIISAYHVQYGGLGISISMPLLKDKDV